MGPGFGGIITLVGIVGGGWVIAIFMFRELWGYFPWQSNAVRDEEEKGEEGKDRLHKEAKIAATCSGFDDPEDRCPRHPSKCVCWKPEVRAAIRAQKQ